MTKISQLVKFNWNLEHASITFPLQTDGQVAIGVMFLLRRRPGGEEKLGSWVEGKKYFCSKNRASFWIQYKKWTFMQPSDCREKPPAHPKGAPQTQIQTRGPGAGVKHSGSALAHYVEITDSSPHTSNLGLACWHGYITWHFFFFLRFIYTLLRGVKISLLLWSLWPRTPPGGQYRPVLAI